MDETPKPGSAKPSRISRREFARRAAIASAAASIAPATALAMPVPHAVPVAPPAELPSGVTPAIRGLLVHAPASRPQKSADEQRAVRVPDFI